MGAQVQIDGVMVLTGAAVLAGLVLYAKRQELINAVNPASDQNVVNQAASKFVQEASDGQYENVGDWVYQTRGTNPIAWIFEGVGRLTGDLP